MFQQQKWDWIRKDGIVVFVSFKGHCNPLLFVGFFGHHMSIPNFGSRNCWRVYIHIYIIPYKVCKWIDECFIVKSCSMCWPCIHTMRFWLACSSETQLFVSLMAHVVHWLFKSLIISPQYWYVDICVFTYVPTTCFRYGSLSTLWSLANTCYLK